MASNLGASAVAANNPDFQNAASQIRVEAGRQRTHPPASRKRTEVEKSARLGETQQKDQSTKELNSVEMEKVGAKQRKASEGFTAEKFIKDLKALAGQNPPRDEEGAKKLAKSDALKTGFEKKFSGDLAAEQGQVIDPLNQRAENRPPVAPAAAKEVVPIPKPVYPAPPRPVNPALVIPKSKPDPEVSLQAEAGELNGAMQKNRISDDQLAQSREPSFLKTLKAKQDAQQKIGEARASYRRQEASILRGATAQANETLSTELSGMSKTHVRTGGDVLGGQRGTEKDTKKRQREIKGTIDRIYNATAGNVQAALAKMVKKVTQDFTNSLKNQTDTFNSNVRRRLDDYYSFGKKAKHFFFGEPKVYVEDDGATRPLTRDDYTRDIFPKPKVKWINPEVYEIFLEEKNAFINAMDRELTTIATDVQNGLIAASAEIETGKTLIANYVKTLKGDEKRFAEHLQEDAKMKFENLEGTIVDAREDLLRTLADQYKESVNQLQTTFNDINEELRKTWLDRAVEFIETVGKTIFQLAELLFSILKRIAYLVWDIIKHPIRFFETLVGGLKQGIGDFIEHIGTHLQEAFWTWLTAAAPGKSIRLSIGSGLAGLFDLVVQVLNLGTADLRAIVDRVLGPAFMQMVDKGIEFAEKAFEPVIILVKKGALAFWHYVQETLGSLIQSAIDRIKDSVFFAFVKKGIMWIAGFFVPGGGFVKIVKAIVRAFQFVAENLDRIRMFFDSVFDSIEAATKGDSSGVASKIITGLKMGIVLALAFLARQLGLNSLIDSVHKIIQGLKRPIVNAIEWVLRKIKPLVTRIVATAKRQVGKVFGKKDKQESEDLREQAANLLAQRLPSERPFAQSKEVVQQVFAELRPAGLKRLELRAQDADGAFPIFAQASDPICVAKLLIPKASVRMVARLTIGDKPLEGVGQRSLAGGFEPYTFIPHPVKHTTRVAWLQPASGAAGIFLKEPPPPLPEGEASRPEAKPESAPESKTLEVFSFNTRDSQTESNISHAERQFIDWFDNQLKIQQRVKEIALFIDRSPCGLCAERDLVPFATRRRTARGNKSLKESVQLSLKYTRPHTGRNPTAVTHINDLKKAGWIVSGDIEVTRKTPEEPVRLETLVGSYSRRASRPKR